MGENIPKLRELPKAQRDLVAALLRAQNESQPQRSATAGCHDSRGKTER